MMNLKQAQGLKVGQLLRVLCDGSGDVDFSSADPRDAPPPEEWEGREYKSGAFVCVGEINTYPAPQGFAVMVTVINGPGRGVDNVFDEGDDGGNYPFEPLTGNEFAEADAALKLFLSDDWAKGLGPAFPYSPDRCPSQHWNNGNDVCADCGTYLNGPAAPADPFRALAVILRRQLKSNEGPTGYGFEEVEPCDVLKLMEALVWGAEPNEAAQRLGFFEPRIGSGTRVKSRLGEAMLGTVKERNESRHGADFVDDLIIEWDAEDGEASGFVNRCDMTEVEFAGAEEQARYDAE